MQKDNKIKPEKRKTIKEYIDEEIDKKINKMKIKYKDIGNNEVEIHFTKNGKTNITTAIITPKEK